LPHERQAEPPALRPARDLCREAVLKDGVGERRFDTGTGVVDAHEDALRLVANRHLDPASAPAARRNRFERVVDEVSDHGDERLRILHVFGQLRLGVHAQLDAALGGNRGLPEQQRDEGWVADALDDRADERLVNERRVVDEANRFVVPFELDQACDHVQLVGEVVLLGSQRRGEIARLIALANELLELGAVS
jgi:hypothetical protein